MPGTATDPGRGVFALRPLGVGEVLDAAVSTIRAYPRVTLAPSAVMYGSLLAAMLGFAGIVAALLYGSDDPALQTVATALGALGVVGAEALGGLLQLGAVAAFSTVMAGVVARAALGRPAPLRAVWRDTSRSLGWLVLYAVMLNAAVLAPLLLLIPLAFVITVPVVGP
ncbi:MAG: hypothetical protein GEU92_21250, partial [Alphaproteobacteria bacterium]|nr:hypothetical protein [Alphaproteobacteria bacterium]